LANVATIIARHDGEILAEGRPNIGSTFLFRFGVGRRQCY
jgi:signal transduction histidine kinase